MSKNLPRYKLKQARVKVGYPNGFYRFNPRTGKKDIHVSPHMRKQMVRDYTYSNRILKRQKLESDWSHLSDEYPNVLGLTDEEIEKFVKYDTFESKEVTQEYIKHIKCFDKDDIREVSKKAFNKFEKTITKDYDTLEKRKGKDPYYKDHTIFITSPRGGFNILGDFGYANKLDKKNFPYDLERFDYGQTIKSESLPYGTSISDINDIVFVDDIYMSGEQCERAYSELKKKINELNVSYKQEPRLHYMAMVGNKHVSQGKTSWDTFTVGEEYNFRRSGKNFEGVSAVVFPFSIPDGFRHSTARKLYKEKKRFEHRKFD